MKCSKCNNLMIQSHPVDDSGNHSMQCATTTCEMFAVPVIGYPLKIDINASYGARVSPQDQLKAHKVKAAGVAGEHMRKAISKLSAASQPVKWEEGSLCLVDNYNGEWQFGCMVPCTNNASCIVFRRYGGSHMIIPVQCLNPYKEPTVQDRASDICEDLFGVTGAECRPDVLLTIVAMLEAGKVKENSNES